MQFLSHNNTLTSYWWLLLNHKRNYNQAFDKVSVQSALMPTLESVAICTPWAEARGSSSESLGFSSVNDLTNVAIDFLRTYIWNVMYVKYRETCLKWNLEIVETCLRWTLKKLEICLKWTLNILDTCLKWTLEIYWKPVQSECWIYLTPA